MNERDKHNAWSEVYHAYCNDRINPIHGNTLGGLAVQWLETRDPGLMDGAISYCHKNQLPILPELLEHVHAAMQKRIADGTSGKKAFKNSAKQTLLGEMAALIYHGATLQRAAEIAAYIAHFQINYPMKASTLEKAYTERRAELEAAAKERFTAGRFSKAEKEKTAELWRAAINIKLEIPQEIIGERR